MSEDSSLPNQLMADEHAVGEVSNQTGSVPNAGEAEESNTAAYSASVTQTKDIVISTKRAPPVSSHDISYDLGQLRASLFQLSEEAAPQDSRDSRRNDKLAARYVGLLSALERPESQSYMPQALLGIRFLLAGRYDGAYKILREIELQTAPSAALSYVMRGIAMFTVLVVVLPLQLTAALLLLPFDLPAGGARIGAFFDQPLGHVVIATFSGMLGAVVSLLLRLKEFETTKGRSPMFLTLTGATLPWVGGMFGAFIAALLVSKVVNLSLSGVKSDDGLTSWLFLVIGFLSGFSERFSRGFVRLAEERLGGGGENPDPGLSISAQTTSTIIKPKKVRKDPKKDGPSSFRKQPEIKGFASLPRPDAEK